MQELRAAIDSLDRELVEKLALRARYIDRAISLKSANGMPARIETRIEDVVAKVSDHAREMGYDPALAEQLWRIIIEWSIIREEASLGADKD